MDFYNSIEAQLDNLDDREKAELAALILNTVKPSDSNLERFFDNLEETVHDELIMRAEERELSE